MITALIVFNLCHWAADFTHLSRPWMLAAKRMGTPLRPILAHAFVHAVLFAIVAFILYGPDAGALAFAIQLPTHFAIDVLKGRMNGWFPSLQSPMNVFHWWVFGADQLAHQVVIILTVYIITL